MYKKNIKELVNLCNQKIDYLINEKEKNILNLNPKYLMEKIKDEGNDKKIYTKMNNMAVIIDDLKELKKIINNMIWTITDEEYIIHHLNPYGILFDRENMYYTNISKFFDLLQEDQLIIFLIEIINSYSEKNFKNEAFLNLCHFGFLNYKPKYAVSTRNKIISLAIENGFIYKYDIFFDRSLKTKRFLNKKYLTNHSKIKYRFTTQNSGWKGIYNHDETINKIINTQ